MKNREKLLRGEIPPNYIARHKWLGRLLYYVAIPVVFAVLYACYGGLQAIASGKESLGWLSLVSAEVFIILLPVAAVLLMRATPLRWPVDPFAAAEIPLFVFACMAGRWWIRTGSLSRAISEVRLDFGDDGNFMWYVLGAVFVFALLCSLSKARMKGNSFYYKHIEKN